MWIEGNQNIKPVINTNQELLKLEGYLEEKDAQASLARFLRYNIGITTELISGSIAIIYWQSQS